jgi:hypothetical protein
MEDLLKRFFPAQIRSQKHKNYRHLQADSRSVGTDAPSSVARPHISLKARMLGGQAETIMRTGGFLR